MNDSLSNEILKDEDFPHNPTFLSPSYGMNEKKAGCDPIVEVVECGPLEDDENQNPERRISKSQKVCSSIVAAVRNYLKFLGPGSVGLCVKLGSVTGLDLSEACRAHLPRWLNYSLYVVAEISIITTDVIQVAGTAIAINLLIPQIPLLAACGLSIFDVIILRALLTPDGPMKGLGNFETFVMALVVGVVVCFCVQLCVIQPPTIGQVLVGYLPSKEVFKSQGLYQACGIMGATITPHNLYLGSGIVQPRLYKYDVEHNLIQSPSSSSSIDSVTGASGASGCYRPSLEAIRACLKLFYIELIICLLVFALFVNSSILITAGATLYSIPLEDADLYGIHSHLVGSLGPVAGTIFALTLLLSGISAGIVGTITGQMLTEGALRWTLRPWTRKLITRSISIMPVFVVIAGVGKQGLNQLMMASQVLLSMILPFITAPLIYFTCRDRYMTVHSPAHREGVVSRNGSISWSTEPPMLETKMANHWPTTAFALLTWFTIATLDLGGLLGKVLSSMEILHGKSLLN